MSGQVRISNAQIDKIYAESRVNEAGFVMLAPHCHPYMELFYTHTGSCSFFVGNDVYNLRQGDFLLIPSDVFHYTRYMFGACKRDNVFFRREDVDGGVAALLPEGENFFCRTQIFRVPEVFRDQTEGLILRMLREEKIADERSALMQRAIFQQLLLLCARECEFLSDLPADIHTTDKPIVEAAKYISARYMDDISTSDIAAAAGYSPNYLSKRFREATGVGVHEYLLFTRLQRAALELMTTNDCVTDIAIRCGFSGANYFKDAFKKKYGVTPREYRK